jgi:hypothetical protein
MELGNNGQSTRDGPNGSKSVIDLTWSTPLESPLGIWTRQGQRRYRIRSPTNYMANQATYNMQPHSDRRKDSIGYQPYDG